MAPTLRVSASDANRPVGPRLERLWWRHHPAGQAAQLCIVLEDGTPAWRVRSALGELRDENAVEPSPVREGEVLRLSHDAAEMFEAPPDGDYVLTVAASIV